MSGKKSNGEGYVGKIGEGRWTARIQCGVNAEGKPKIKAFYAKTQKEVRKKLKDFLSADETNTDRSLEPFGDYLFKWLNLYKKNNVKETTFDRDETIILKHIVPQIGHIQVASLTVDHLQVFFNYMRESKYSEDYMKKAKFLLNNCLSYAEFNGEIKKNPMGGMKALPKSLLTKKEIVFLDEDDIVKFVSAATQTYGNGKPVYRYGQAIVFILYTGLRVGEALNLRWSDIDLERKVVHVTGNVVLVKNRDKKFEGEPNYKVVADSSVKTSSGLREVALCQSAISAIMAFKDIVEPVDKSQRIFATKEGNINGRRNILRSVQSIADTADLSIGRCNIHALRHTFASMLFRRGVDVKTVSALLGHSKVTLTYDIYIHLIEEQKKEAVSLLDSM